MPTQNALLIFHHYFSDDRTFSISCTSKEYSPLYTYCYRQRIRESGTNQLTPQPPWAFCFLLRRHRGQDLERRGKGRFPCVPTEYFRGSTWSRPSGWGGRQPGQSWRFQRANKKTLPGGLLQHIPSSDPGHRWVYWDFHREVKRSCFWQLKLRYNKSISRHSAEYKSPSHLSTTKC